MPYCRCSTLLDIAYIVFTSILELLGSVKRSASPTCPTTRPRAVTSRHKRHLVTPSVLRLTARDAAARDGEWRTAGGHHSGHQAGRSQCGAAAAQGGHRSSAGWVGLTGDVRNGLIGQNASLQSIVCGSMALCDLLGNKPVF